MIQLIIGEKGKGKTKILLEKANAEIKTVSGNIVYIDKSKQHMYELSNRVRLIDISAFPVQNTDAFLGFLCGLISRDNDLQQVYLDSFLTIADVDPDAIEPVLTQINKLSKVYDVDFIISASVTKDQIPEEFSECIIHE